MRLKSKHKLYGTILGLCGLALLADKAFFGPSEASAESSPEDLLVVPDDSDSLSSMPQNGADATTAIMNATAAQLNEVASSRPLLTRMEFRDAFTPDPSWAPPKTVEDVVIDDGSPADVFRLSHELQAVMAGAGGGYAIVNGQGLHIGQTLDGYELVRIDEDAVVFRAEGLLVELVLQRTTGNDQ